MISDRERQFLEKIGISSGPWETESGFIVSRDQNIILQTWDKTEIDYENNKNNQRFISKAPEMFLALFHRAYTGCKVCEHMPKNNPGCIGCRGNSEIKTIESAICKTFQQLVDIWETCV